MALRGVGGGGVCMWWLRVLLSHVASVFGGADTHPHNNGWHDTDTPDSTWTPQLMGAPWWLWVAAVLVLFLWRVVCGSLGWRKGHRSKLCVSPGLPCGVCSDQGARASLEDRWACMGLQLPVDRFYVPPLIPYETLAPGTVGVCNYYSIFDGHGGAGAAQYCAQSLHRLLASDVGGVLSHPPTALAKAFRSADDELLRRESVLGGQVGTTAVVALVQGSTLHVANAGDCRALLIQRGALWRALSVDHKACNEDERKRVEAAGGRVSQVMGTYRVQGVLAVARALGDAWLKPWVVADPEVCSVSLGPDDLFLLLASDGLWDVLSNEQAAHLVVNHAPSPTPIDTHPHEALECLCRVLCDEALLAGCSDNVTAVVVDLRQHHNNTTPRLINNNNTNNTPEQHKHKHKDR